MVVKCRFCDKNATRITALYSLTKPVGLFNRLIRKVKSGKYHKDPVCREHYLAFSHGIETVTCSVCNKKTLLEMDDFYDMHEIHCSHCGYLISSGGASFD